MKQGNLKISDTIYTSPYKKKKNVSLACANPINLEEEEKKFFESNFSVNPIFKYKNEEQVEKFMK